MAKPVYSLVYAILVAVGLLALVLFNRLLNSEDATPAAQASLQRNEETAREARDAVAEGAEKSEKAEAAGAADAAAMPDGRVAEAPASRAEPAAEGKEEEARK